MERIVYQKTLDVHKNGVQFTLSGFETADNLARRIEISLMASGDAIDFPLEKIMAVMYVNVPGTSSPSVVECEIKDNTIIYDVLPIVNEGITEMQLKLIEIEPEGAKKVLATPKFAIEVSKSNTNEEGVVQTTAFTALEDALSRAKAVYDSRFLRMELSSDCMFRAFYADGTVFESDMLRELFHKGESILSQSYARGDTGIRTGEKTDNSMYYSRVAKGASIESQTIKKEAQEILDEVRQHGVYTAFKVNFETGEVEYISPRYNFKINTEDGNLEAIGQSIILEDEIGLIVTDWLVKNKAILKDIQKKYEEKSEEVASLEKRKAERSEVYTKEETVSDETKMALGLKPENTPNDAFAVLYTASKALLPWNVDENVGQINAFKGETYFRPPLATVVNGTYQYLPEDMYIDIPIINSGQVYLSFSVKQNMSGYNYTHIFAVDVLVNDKVVNSVNVPSRDTTLIESGLVLLDLKPGDTVRIRINSTCSDEIHQGTIYVKDISLFANINTAYKYVSLRPGTTIYVDTNEQVIDALLGVNG